MASITIRNMPADLLERLRQGARVARRSVNQHILCLLEQALTTVEPTANGNLHAKIEEQIRAWEALAGK